MVLRQVICLEIGDIFLHLEDYKYVIINRNRRRGTGTILDVVHYNMNFPKLSHYTNKNALTREIHLFDTDYVTFVGKLPA